jgi:hypothetical protein
MQVGIEVSKMLSTNENRKIIMKTIILKLIKFLSCLIFYKRSYLRISLSSEKLQQILEDFYLTGIVEEKNSSSGSFNLEYSVQSISNSCFRINRPNSISAQCRVVSDAIGDDGVILEVKMRPSNKFFLCLIGFVFGLFGSAYSFTQFIFFVFGLYVLAIILFQRESKKILNVMKNKLRD